MNAEDAAIIASVPAAEHRRHGIPDDVIASRRSRAAELAADVLASDLLPGGIRTSPLGAAWSTDVDAHVRRLPDRERLLQAGWRPLDGLLIALGSDGTGRWAVVEHGRVLGKVDVESSPPPDPLAAVLRRSQRRCEVRLREVLELRVLRRGGATLPDHAVVRAAARIEKHWGGGDLVAWLMDDPVAGPVRLGPSWRRATHRHRPRRPRVVIAFSGVDGSGKSSLAARIAGELDAAGVPVSMVWARPGMHLRILDRAARLAKRALRQPAAPGVRAAATGHASDLRSRRGAIGWLWAVSVTAAFLRDVRKQHRRARGVVLYDRHLLDACATLRFAYGSVDLRIAEAMVRWFLPQADHTFYLDLPAQVAVGRKPGDVIGFHAVKLQLEVYRQLAPTIRRLTVLDGTSCPSSLDAAVLAAVCQ